MQYYLHKNDIPEKWDPGPYEDPGPCEELEP